MEFIERHFRAIALFALMMVLVAAHAFMIHYGRSEQQIQWAETLISGAEGALIVLLTRTGDKSSNGDQK